MVSGYVNKLCPFLFSNFRRQYPKKENFMPGWKTHMIIGATTGAVVNVAMQAGRKALNPKTPFDFGEFLICTGAASMAALVPDILEPASSPNHRAFFHSVVTAAIVAYAMT